jgi:cation diffusion facilitator CzcD-associated flavoprotein CzcO
VDVRANPIAEITPKGLRTVDGEEHELDVLVFATGFDGITGSFRNIDIRGRGGKSLGQEHWSFEAGRDGSTYLGVAVADFPNMFTAFGPHGPFANNPWSIQAQVEFIAELIGHAERQEARTIEATRDAEDSWVKSSNAAVAGTLLLSVDSWLTGGNVPGKPKQVLLHLAGLAEYRKKVTEVAEHNFEGFLLEPAEVSPSAGI